MTLRIREASPGDAPALASLASQLGYPCSADQAALRLLRLPAGSATVLVAEDAGVVLGWIHVGVHTSLLVDDTPEILGLIVDHQHRGLGIGSMLLSAVESWSISRGYSTIMLQSNILRTDAHEFYRRQGFRDTKTSLTFTKDLDDQQIARPLHGPSRV